MTDAEISIIGRLPMIHTYETPGIPRSESISQTDGIMFFFSYYHLPMSRT